MVPGRKAARQASIDEVAEKTIKCLKACVPSAVPGIAYLSGGQSDEDATAHLSRMNEIGGFPWKMTFSYGRALQAPALKAWKGQAANVAAAQKALLHRSKCNSAACSGRYTAALEKEVLTA
mgnify:CR=1 FL=1